MTVTVRPRPLRGSITAPPSKSDAHRKLICAALAREETRLQLEGSSQDIEATLSCLRALGAQIRREGSVLHITPIGRVPEQPLLDCGESGSTLRFLLPVAAALCPRVRFTGRGRLPLRPLGPLADAMAAHGVRISDTWPLETEGLLQPGEYRLPGNVSSQYFTGLLLALPLLQGDSRITLTAPLESASYVEITRQVLARFGIRGELGPGGIPGGQQYRSPGLLSVEGDWSGAAFFLCAGAISGDVTLRGLRADSPQGDRAVCSLLGSLGARVETTPEGLRVRPGALLGREIDVSGVPDLAPVLAVTAAFCRGESRFTGAGRLRIKESDRIASACRLLRDLGGNAEEEENAFSVSGGQLRGGQADGMGDHRIVMSAAVAACGCREDVTVLGAEAAAKSYPGFWDDYQRLGGEIRVSL